MSKVLLICAIFVATCTAAMPQTYTFSKGGASTSSPLATVATAGSATVYSSSADAASLGSSDDSLESSSNFDSGSSATVVGYDSLSASKSSSGSTGVSLTIGSASNATSTIESTYTNWVGSSLGSASDTACYREAHVASECPLGFDSNVETCWAQCPLSYPVQCGLECIRQNDDCALEVVTKISTVVQSALSLATFGLYGEFKLLAKGLQTAVKCGKEMMGLVKSLSKYVRTVKVNDPQTTQDQLLTMLYQTDNVIFDVPVTIASCLGIKVSDDVKFADRVLNTAELALKEIIANGATIVSSWSAFTSFMTNITLGDSLDSLNETDITSLQSALESNSTCGYDMKRLLDRTWMTVAELRQTNPDISEDDIRVVMSESNLVLNEVPTVTNNCMEELVAGSDEATAYSTRDTLRKTFGGIVDDLISSGTSSNGTFLTAEEYAYKIADKALTFYAVWDVTNVAGVVSEFFQTVCGPTQFIGNIDDGSAEEALGLSMVDDAFNSSFGAWTKVGDGIVSITFQSTDTEDVTVNIKSGGSIIDEVDVAAGETVTWTSNTTALGGKTLYLDRWRPGLLGLPGTGGGSLLLWVPRADQGGHLELTAMLNVS